MPRPIPPVVRWLLWLGALALWTFLLLSARAPGVVTEVVTVDYALPVKKLGHVVGYAVLSVLTCWLPLSWRVRGVLALGLLLHACLTEWLQNSIANRTGKPIDVGLDALGLLIGLGAWNLASRRQS